MIVSGKPILNIEETNLDAEGNEKVILTSKVPLQDRDGTITGMLGIFADITARKQMEKDLSRSKESGGGVLERRGSARRGEAPPARSGSAREVLGCRYNPVTPAKPGRRRAATADQASAAARMRARCTR